MLKLGTAQISKAVLGTTALSRAYVGSVLVLSAGAFIDADFTTQTYKANGVSKTFAQMFSFSRGSDATYYNSAGLLKIVTGSDPRFDYDPSTLVARGIMHEKAGTNLYNYSENFSNAYWTKTNLNAFGALDTGAAGAGSFQGTSRTLDPAGGNNAAFIQVNATASVIHGLRRDITLNTNLSVVPAWYVKPAGYNFCAIRVLDGTATSNGIIAVFNLSTGTVDNAQKIGAGVQTGVGIKALPNGWFAVYVIGTPNTTANATLRTELIIKDSGGTGVNINGDNTSGLFVFGADIKQDFEHTSYVPATGAASATRNAETMTTAVGKIKSIKAEFRLRNAPASGSSTIVQVDSGADTPTTRVSLAVNSSSLIRLNGDTTGVGTIAYTAGSTASVETSWDDVFLYEKVGTNPTSQVADSSQDTFTTCRIGQSVGGDNANMWLGKLVLNTFPTLASSLTPLPSGAPSQFDWFLQQYEIFIKGDGKGATTFDFDKFKPGGVGNWYNISPSGNNSNSGLTMASPLLTIDGALAKGDCIGIILQATMHARNVLPNAVLSGTTPSVSVVVENGGRASISGSDMNLTWSVNGTYADVYETARTSAAQGVVDLSVLAPDGLATVGDVKTSLIDVHNSAGPCVYSDGTKWYAKTGNGRVPDNNLIISVQQSFILQPTSGICKWTFENIDFLGDYTISPRASSLTAYPILAMRDCKIRYCPKTSQGNGLQNLGADTYLINCDFTKNAQDGVNYKKNGGRYYRGYEEGCTYRWNGDPTTALNDNASTTHDGGTDAGNQGVVIRINCKGGMTYGPTYADVKDGGQNPWILMVGCEGEGSNKASVPINFTSDCYGRYINCLSYGTRSFDFLSTSGSNVKAFGPQTYTYTGPAGVFTQVGNLADIW